MRVLEIGCGTGAASRAAAHRDGDGFVLGLDRSPSAIATCLSASKDEIDSGTAGFRIGSVEDFELAHGEAPYDLAFAVRVGALDGRHPDLERILLQRIGTALTEVGRQFVDGGDPTREIDLPRNR